jgi:phage-related minor tail protein
MSADTDGLDAAAFAVSDLTAVKATLEGIDASALRVSKTLSGAFASAIVGGKSFNETLTIIAASLTKVFLSAGLQPLTQGLTSMLTSGLGSLVGAGGATPVAPFAEGGVVASPTFFGSGKSLGLMGERGAEAILPLARGPDGRLGVAAQGGAARPVAVNVSIATPDAESFRRSEGQIAAALARAVARGNRSL